MQLALINLILKCLNPILFIKKKRIRVAELVQSQLEASTLTILTDTYEPNLKAFLDKLNLLYLGIKTYEDILHFYKNEFRKNFQPVTLGVGEAQFNWMYVLTVLIKKRKRQKRLK